MKRGADHPVAGHPAPRSCLPEKDFSWEDPVAPDDAVRDLVSLASPAVQTADLDFFSDRLP